MYDDDQWSWIPDKDTIFLKPVAACKKIILIVLVIGLFIFIAGIV